MACCLLQFDSTRNVADEVTQQLTRLDTVVACVGTSELLVLLLLLLLQQPLLLLLRELKTGKHTRDSKRFLKTNPTRANYIVNRLSREYNICQT